LGKDNGVKGPPAWVIGNLNGTERRALDWGHTLIRLQRELPLGGLPLWVPAVHFGETGAAAGLLAVCMVLRAFVRGYAPGNRALVWLASDNRPRGVLLLQRLHVN
jgi:3-oxoacyl-[acyl-carrier-protein] synthase-1